MVLTTATCGLCGSYNNNVINAAYKLHYYLEENKKSLIIYIIRKKIKIYFKKLYKKYFIGLK